MVKSTFIENGTTHLSGKIPASLIINQYQKQFNIDVTNVFGNLKEVEIYQCDTSGYRFYYPLNLSGDSKFYEKLQEYDWYYLPWKWEHAEFSKLVRDHDQILEVGCGKGDFIHNLIKQNDTIQCVGLELNESSVKSFERFEILNERIENHCKANKEKYDLVCSFQVLEHISDVSPFLHSKIDCLKKNGTLVICVPNNDSFIKYGDQDVLNMPPHHMGLWNTESLKSIGKYYGVELIDIKYEPLQDYHFDFYFRLSLKKYLGDFLSKSINRIFVITRLNYFVSKYLKKRSNKIKGHSILAIYRKN
ncbi:class I SAM-dependent methyltransferase [Fluviicola sp.]|jgi:2-polyprenyl-3-methyl-5-hydroxy-6-metoxy-1,4-benzoquinol methylase|uniref:class I SAM-dependent methyltransferase n=1 Tax=Fluviicola sp. TaxID=1917219 RepID=UPI00281BFB3E|nr:class I SAM-dependent methyltransferase [Fluviicola sp.]MDR0801808.1 class I SAM-dependent methyltransferase [Fluviicola sp.]